MPTTKLSNVYLSISGAAASSRAKGLLERAAASSAVGVVQGERLVRPGAVSRRSAAARRPAASGSGFSPSSGCTSGLETTKRTWSVGAAQELRQGIAQGLGVLLLDPLAGERGGAPSTTTLPSQESGLRGRSQLSKVGLLICVASARRVRSQALRRAMALSSSPSSSCCSWGLSSSGCGVAVVTVPQRPDRGAGGGSDKEGGDHSGFEIAASMPPIIPQIPPRGKSFFAALARANGRQPADQVAGGPQDGVVVRLGGDFGDGLDVADDAVFVQQIDGAGQQAQFFDPDAEGVGEGPVLVVGEHLDVVDVLLGGPALLRERRVGADGDDFDLVRRQAGDVPVELAGLQRADAGVDARAPGSSARPSAPPSLRSSQVTGDRSLGGELKVGGLVADLEFLARPGSSACP